MIWRLGLFYLQDETLRWSDSRLWSIIFDSQHYCALLLLLLLLFLPGHVTHFITVSTAATFCSFKTIYLVGNFLVGNFFREIFFLPEKNCF